MSGGAGRRFVSSVWLAHLVFKRSGQPKRVKKWDDAKHAERTVDQSPTNGYLANGSANQRQRNHEHTGNDTSLQNPNVAHGVNECANEENSNDEVCESQPVGAVSQPRIPGVTLPEAVSDGENPAVEAVSSLGRCHVPKAPD